MRNRFFALLPLFAVVGLGAAGCMHAAPAAKPAEPAADLQKPAPKPDAQAASDMQFMEGAGAFKQNCAGCHSPGSGSPNLMQFLETEERIKTKVRNGGGMMPAFTTEQISDTQLDAIVVFLRQSEQDAGAKARPARRRS